MSFSWLLISSKLPLVAVTRLSKALPAGLLDPLPPLSRIDPLLRTWPLTRRPQIFFGLNLIFNGIVRPLSFPSSLVYMPS